MDKKYYPGIHKLMYHTDHINNMKNKVPIAPIHISVWPTIQCQLNCPYCCCKGESRKYENDLSYPDFENACNTLVKYGTKAMEFSGGGEPLLWPWFNRAVEYAHSKGLKLSLITNGILLKHLPKSTIDKLSWIRISVQSALSANHILRNIRDTDKMSLSYMVTDIDEINYMCEVAKTFNIVVRLAIPKPSNVDKQILLDKLAGNDNHLVFFSDKEDGTPKACYMPWIRAAITWEGIFIPCPSIQLTQEYKGHIPKSFYLCHVSDLEKWILNNPVRDMGYKCSYCNCGKDHNDFLYSYFNGKVELTKPNERIQDVDFV
jgi:MoaA/NifB/PqqE/SkfB family radical SAM enzyme